MARYKREPRFAAVTLPRLSSKLLNGLSRRSGNARTVARPFLPPSAPRQVASSSQPCLGGRLLLRAKPLLRREGRSASRASPSLLRPALEIHLGFAKDSRSTRSPPLRAEMNWRGAGEELWSNLRWHSSGRSRDVEYGNSQMISQGIAIHTIGSTSTLWDRLTGNGEELGN